MEVRGKNAVHLSQEIIHNGIVYWKMESGWRRNRSGPALENDGLDWIPPGNNSNYLRDTQGNRDSGELCLIFYNLLWNRWSFLSQTLGLLWPLRVSWFLSFSWLLVAVWPFVDDYQLQYIVPNSYDCMNGTLPLSRRTLLHLHTYRHCIPITSQIYFTCTLIQIYPTPSKSLLLHVCWSKKIHIHLLLPFTTLTRRKLNNFWPRLRYQINW